MMLRNNDIDGMQVVDALRGVAADEKAPSPSIAGKALMRKEVHAMGRAESVHPLA